MRAFRAQNIESAKSRLIMCAEDIRDQLEKMGNTSELCSQLGAVLGMLGDCCCVTVIRNSTFILNLNACCKSKYDNVSFLELFDLDIDMDMDMDLVQCYLGMVCLGYGYVSNMGMFSFYKIFMYLVESLED
ncbi:hypothetical protein Golob_006541 [Gossypium lobatum]|uniref:Uncharacterized protein n=1 Tax=Gossypium lobatum TaxID=34289 RepID=A0A7J8MWQ5_9ROSI|nr:hypothetical protein [Gossypium lobatum]